MPKVPEEGEYADLEALNQLVENPVADSFDEDHNHEYRHLEEDGKLRKVRWAKDRGISRTLVGDKTEGQKLTIPDEEGEHDMAHSTATGDALVSNGYLGVDLIRVEEGDGFVPHTHPGDHILIPVYGTGTITYDGDVYKSRAGEVYIIEGEVPHAVGAITDVGILAVGAPHAPIDSDERMTPVEYEEVETEFETLNCLICDEEAKSPKKLHDFGCDHCPCYDCISPEDS